MILIASLNFADALVGLSLVLEPVSILVDYTECGFDVLAQMALINYFGTLVSQCHTVALSIDRWIAVQHALNYHSIMSPFRFKLLVATSWIIASVEILIFSLMNYFGLCFWNYKGLFDVTNILPFLHIVVVFTINAVIYGKLWSVARRQRRQIAQLQQQQNNTTGVNKATVMVMVIVALFGLLWTPVVIGRILQLFVSDSASDRIDVITQYFFLVGSSNSLINCIVYVFFNKNLRSLIRRKLKCLECSI